MVQPKAPFIHVCLDYFFINTVKLKTVVSYQSGRWATGKAELDAIRTQQTKRNRLPREHESKQTWKSEILFPRRSPDRILNLLDGVRGFSRNSSDLPMLASHFSFRTFWKFSVVALAGKQQKTLDRFRSPATAGCGRLRACACQGPRRGFPTEDINFTRAFDFEGYPVVILNDMH